MYEEIFSKPQRVCRAMVAVVNVDGVEVASGGEFEFSEEATFGSCESGEVSAAGGAGRGGAREESVQESAPSLQ